MADDHYLQRELYDRVANDPAIFDFLQDGSLDGIWYWDIENPEEEWMSPRMWEVLGFDPAEMPHSPSAWQDFIDPDDLAVALDNFNRHCEDPSHPYDQVVRYRGGSRGTVWVRCRGMAIRDDDGKPIRLLGAHTDITELMQARDKELAVQQQARQQAERANAGKDALLANVSHELRTPMNGVIGLIEVLLRSDPRPDQRDHLLTMRDSAGALLRVLNDLLDLSRLTEGRMTLEASTFQLPHLVRSVLRLHQPQAQATGTTLALHLAPDLPDRVVGDPMRLRQVLTNLLNNGLKFARGGRVGLSVGRAGERVAFCVEDDGPGLTPEQQARVFEAFVQGSVETARQHGGTGLGLSISQRLVSALGGVLRVDSAPGEGARFSFTLPLPPAAPLPDPLEAAVHAEPTGDSGCHLLVAEDNAINRRVVKALLLSAGHSVDFALNGEEAVRMALAQPYDLVLMDIQMPELDGTDAAVRIRASRSAEELPIVALTAMAGPSEREMALSCGMQDVLTKPFTPEALEAVIRRFSPRGDAPSR